MIEEKNSTKVFMPGFDGPLVSFSLFNELQHNILPSETIEQAYKDYKTKYEQKRYQAFYSEHQHDEWFREKYEPELNQKWRSERNNQCSKLANNFIKSLNEGSFKDLKLQLREQDENNKNVKILIHYYNKEKDMFEEKERDILLNQSQAKGSSNAPLDISSPPYFGFDPDKLTLFLHQIPRNVSRMQILDVLKKFTGFISMSLSEPIKNNSYFRYCWVSFDSFENCESAYESLNDYKISSDYRISPIKSKSSILKKIRMTPPWFDERIEDDLEISKNLIHILDKEKNISLTNNMLLEPEESRDKVFQLDLQILYLRRVHGFCYYCLEEFEDERMLATRCDNIHLRNYKTIGSRLSYENYETIKNEVEWDKNFTKHIKLMIENRPVTNKNVTKIIKKTIVIRTTRRTKQKKELIFSNKYK
jgi:hypothetical protein